MKSRLFIAVYALLAVFITLNRGIWKENQVITWDGTGYYMYLPAFIIYEDPGQLAFYHRIDSLYLPSLSLGQYGIHEHAATGRRSIRYPVGVALFELPGFLVADVITRHFTSYPADGYSAPYQLGVSLSTILWGAIGLLVLRRFLLRHFTEGIVWKVLLLIALGTNFYYYTAFFQGWSHAYSFFLFAAVLALTDAWYRTGKLQHAVLLGATLGLAVITRPTNAVIMLIPLLWPAPAGFPKLELLRNRILQLAAALAAFCLVLMIQLSYWKYATGDWLYYTYTDEGFDFLHPKIWKGLFSWRKGWFVYTPIGFLFCLGLIPLYRRRRGLFLPVLAFLAVHIYIIFSWKIWHYASSFSCRPMVEALPVLALPAAALLEAIASSRRRIAGIAFACLAGALVVLNIFQTYQFSLKVLSYDRMTRAYYWRIFGKLKVTEADQQLLLPPAEAADDK